MFIVHQVWIDLVLSKIHLEIYSNFVITLVSIVVRTDMITFIINKQSINLVYMFVFTEISDDYSLFGHRKVLSLVSLIQGIDEMDLK